MHAHHGEVQARVPCSLYGQMGPKQGLSALSIGRSGRSCDLLPGRNRWRVRLPPTRQSRRTNDEEMHDEAWKALAVERGLMLRSGQVPDQDGSFSPAQASSRRIPAVAR